MAFYAYTHARPNREGVDAIFYVGKGQRQRDRDFIHRTQHHKNIVAKYGRDNIVVVRYPCADEADAHRLEKLLIASYRAAGVRLTNLTDGGDGISGHRHSEETKAKISASNMGKVISPEARRRVSEALKGRPGTWRGRKHSEETKTKLRAAKLGSKNPSASRPMSEETKAKISATKLAKTGGVSGRYRGAPGRSPEERAARKEAQKEARSQRQRDIWASATERRARAAQAAKERFVALLKTDNPSWRSEVKAKQGAAAKARWANPEYRTRQIEALRWSDERKAAFSASNPSHDPEVNAKKSAKLKGYQWKRIECPHCGLVGAEPPMKRYHFDNCKKKETE